MINQLFRIVASIIAIIFIGNNAFAEHKFKNEWRDLMKPVYFDLTDKKQQVPNGEHKIRIAKVIKNNPYFSEFSLEGNFNGSGYPVYSSTVNNANLQMTNYAGDAIGFVGNLSFIAINTSAGVSVEIILKDGQLIKYDKSTNSRDTIEVKPEYEKEFKRNIEILIPKQYVNKIPEPIKLSFELNDITCPRVYKIDDDLRSQLSIDITKSKVYIDQEDANIYYSDSVQSRIAYLNEIGFNLEAINSSHVEGNVSAFKYQTDDQIKYKVEKMIVTSISHPAIDAYYKALQGDSIGIVTTLNNFDRLYFSKYKSDELYRSLVNKAVEMNIPEYQVLKGEYLRAYMPNATEQGIAVERKRLYTEAASQGYIPAMLRLGNIYKYEEKDYKKMIYWWTKASDLGSEAAMIDLAEYYDEKKDPETACKWYQKAIDTGSLFTEQREDAERYIRKYETELEKKKELEKVLKELEKKYGKKYVDAMRKGEIIVGMPSDLVGLICYVSLVNVSAVSSDSNSYTVKITPKFYEANSLQNVVYATISRKTEKVTYTWTTRERFR